MKYPLLTFAFLFAFLSSIAQKYDEPLISDRSGVNNTAFLVKPNTLQWEYGTFVEDINDSTRNTVFLNNIFRLGISKRFEARLTQDVAQSKTGSEAVTGLDYTLGIKANLFHENGALPETSVIVQYGGELDLLFLFQNNFSDKFNTVYNVAFNSLTAAKSEGYHALTFTYVATNRFSVFVEPWGLFGAGYEQRLLGGLIYLVNNQLQVDLNAALSFESSDYQFVGGGLVYLF